MSMSTHVVGFRDDRWTRMKAVWDACEAAGTSIPDEVDEFFDGETPDPAGIEVELKCDEWRDDSGEGLEIAIADLPTNITKIRFYNSW
jgi:hypothetical protein